MPDLDTIDIASVCHEANRALQDLDPDDVPGPHWPDAPDWQRKSAIEGVEHALRGLSPAALHQAWCDSKVADGWTYGPRKDPAAKTHPCLVPYADLPAHQRIKDALFAAIVRTLAAGQPDARSTEVDRVGAELNETGKARSHAELRASQAEARVAALEVAARDVPILVGEMARVFDRVEGVDVNDLEVRFDDLRTVADRLRGLLGLGDECTCHAWRAAAVATSAGPNTRIQWNCPVHGDQAHPEPLEEAPDA